MEFSRQEYWSGLPCPPPGDLPNLGIKPISLMSPALAGWFFTTEPLGNMGDLAESDGEGNGAPLQYSRLESPMDGGAW